MDEPAAEKQLMVYLVTASAKVEDDVSEQAQRGLVDPATVDKEAFFAAVQDAIANPVPDNVLTDIALCSMLYLIKWIAAG